MTVAADLAARYRRDGYVCPLPALGAHDVRRYRDALEDFERTQGGTLGELPGQLRAKTHLLFTWMDELVRIPAVLDAVEALIGPDILVYHVTCWFKEPRDPSYVSWHQDATYFHLEPFEHVTAWIALSDSTPESGCVAVLPGTHREGQRPHSEHRAKHNLLSNGQTVEAAVDESVAVPLTVPAGSFSLHHTHIVHSSNANKTDARRLGVGVSYIPTRVRFTGPGRLTAALVRGEDRFGHFDLETPPRTDFDAAARARHAEAVDRFFNSHGSKRSEVA